MKFTVDVQSVFCESRKILRYYVGLELTLIELVHLRKCVINTLNDLAVIEQICNSFQPATEVAVRFLHQEYGLTCLDSEIYEPILSGYYSKTASEILNWLQDKMHFP